MMALVVCFWFSNSVSAAQTVPYKLNFQGRLTNTSGTVLSGTYDMQFKLYTALTGGTLIWSETRTAANANAVTITNGLFSVLIGEGTAVAGSSATLQAAVTANTTMYMEVMVGSETLTPRSQFGSAAYAINSDFLDGQDSSAFAPATGSTSYAPMSGSTNYAPISGSTNYAPISGSTNYIQNQTASPQATSGFNISGNGTIGGVGTVTGNFTNNGAAMFYNSANSTAAFTIQRQNADDMFVADTSNSRVYIGSTTVDTSAVVLVLDSVAADPGSAVNGSEYYNSTNSKFRCYQNSMWQDCITHNKLAITADVTDSSGACTFTNITGMSFAVVSGTTYRFRATIIYTSAATTTGIGLAATGPAAVPFAYNFTTALTANTAGGGGGSAGTGGCVASSLLTTTAGNTAEIEGVITPTANGTVQLTFASEINSSAVVIKSGSMLEWW